MVTPDPNEEFEYSLKYLESIGAFTLILVDSEDGEE